jgi:hypothetical protein
MKTIHRAVHLLLAVLCLSVLAACNKEKELLVEVPKSIDGKWQIVKASRNGVDITEAMDFSQFRIHFLNDNTYQMENYIPFIVKADGKWSLDDPQYPFRITFLPTGQTEPLVTQLNFPTVNGKRQIRLSFSPGCSANTYEYILEKAPQ